MHIGLGGFHRAHMARYSHELMERDDQALGWGILGAVLMPNDRRMVESLVPQDGLYTLIEREGTQERARIIGSLAGVADATESSEPLLAALDDPAIRIVSLTVTENGYCLNAATKRLDPEHRLIRADLAAPERPRSAIGVIVEMLRRRRERALPPPTVLSCDNIQHNGEVLRQAVLDLASLRNDALSSWIESAVSFPSTMVDRITPVTAQADIDGLASRHGLIDRWPVVSETFSQWVIEDRFPQGRPSWEDVGAQFVEDVAPYEFMKLRLLNGSHLAVSGLGQLAGYVTIDESMADARIQAVMRALMDRETGPTLPAIPGVDIAAYKARLIERFANSAIRDTVQRVNSDAPINVLVDPIRDRLKTGGDVTFLALALAAWLRRVRGVDERGAPLVVTHPLAVLLREKALEGDADPRPLLSINSLFGELRNDPRLVDAVGYWLASLYRDGIEATLDEAARRAS
ncbi:mannitol dehydrogenase family protein [Bosea sp. NBC_00550]|uniref:mannitol dehydrogenase family protein n=1 Tax=Bosea sp. NBC_00550 TaxID=2969621 RepID=UPI00222E16BF|nr:mannitol dehydrogenase family protein [Bosea sp. NBC_00550]UZF91105.1 mannitol dehydrogenase family protein [Bosea sp. NBC_00550]